MCYLVMYLRMMMEENHFLCVSFLSVHRVCIITIISNNNWTEWSTMQGVIGRDISKLDEREVRGRFEIMSTITP